MAILVVVLATGCRTPIADPHVSSQRTACALDVSDTDCPVSRVVQEVLARHGFRRPPIVTMVSDDGARFTADRSPHTLEPTEPGAPDQFDRVFVSVGPHREVRSRIDGYVRSGNDWVQRDRSAFDHKSVKPYGFLIDPELEAKGIASEVKSGLHGHGRLFLARSDYDRRFGRAVGRVFDKHGFTIPWLVVHGPDSSLWFVGERFHSLTEFERVFAVISEGGHVHVRIEHRKVALSDWASGGGYRFLSDAEEMARKIEDELAAEAGSGQ